MVVEVAYVDGERWRRVHASCRSDVPCNRWRNSSLGEIPSSDDGVVERHCCATEGGGRMVWRVLSMMEVLVALVPSIVIAVGVGGEVDRMYGGAQCVVHRDIDTIYSCLN
jgi:hypothetical protein